MRNTDLAWDTYAWFVAAEKRLERAENAIEYFQEIGVAIPEPVMREFHYADNAHRRFWRLWFK